MNILRTRLAKGGGASRPRSGHVAAQGMIGTIQVTTSADEARPKKESKEEKKERKSRQAKLRLR